MIFSSLFESLQTLFWGTFGLIDLQTFQIYKRHTFTMFVGLLMYGVYSSIMIIVLLNMLIAMMSNSYQYIAVCVQNIHLKDLHGGFDCVVLEFVRYGMEICTVCACDGVREVEGVGIVFV